MNKYIDINELGIGRADPKIFNNPEYANGWNSAIEIIEKAPAADVKEVKHGEWITDKDGFVTCSECGEEHTWDDFRPSFCDMCGARMDGGVKK